MQAIDISASGFSPPQQLMSFSPRTAGFSDPGSRCQRYQYQARGPLRLPYLKTVDPPRAYILACYQWER